MAVDTQQIMDEAEKLGRLVAQHPSVENYRKAQRAIAEDPEASRSLAEFDRQLESLARQEQGGMAITDAQRQALENLQSRIVSNIKIKALNMAQVEFMDLLRKVTQTVQRPLTEAAGGGSAGGNGGPGRTPAAPAGPKIM
ncbi:MAG TPA: YlbF family regulator [Tepidisphaeraceae bacterium]|nr:YlbF family regulator [Tepidisphaeraceae bacterium]